jgi:hypothetical protein
MLGTQVWQPESDPEFKAEGENPGSQKSSELHRNTEAHACLSLSLSHTHTHTVYLLFLLAVQERCVCVCVAYYSSA